MALHLSVLFLFFRSLVVAKKNPPTLFWLAGAYQIVGSSLLFVYDRADLSASTTRVFMIDFANTVAKDGEVDHTGNGLDSDGYLFGLDRLIEQWDALS